MTGNLLEPELHCGRKTAEPCNDLEIRIAFVDDGDRVHDSVFLDGCEQVFDVLDLADIVVGLDVFHVENAEIVGPFFRLFRCGLA